MDAKNFTIFNFFGCNGITGVSLINAFLGNLFFENSKIIMMNYFLSCYNITIKKMVFMNTLMSSLELVEALITFYLNSNLNFSDVYIGDTLNFKES